MLALFAQTMPGAPPEIGWLAPVVLFLLGAAAAIDAGTGRIPDPLVFLALLVTAATQGFAADWPLAARHLATGLGAGCALYALNFLWYRFFRRDAIGMGDAKWSMAAVACFGLAPSAIGWGIGAILGILWMGALKLARKRVAHIHFAPFLFAGLLAGIWWLRLRG